MDILNPKVVWIEDRCYRVLSIPDSAGNKEDEEPRSIRIHDDDDYDPDLAIMHQGNRFHITIHVPASLIKYVNGAQGKKLKALTQYGVKINIPHPKNADQGITISGSTKKVVSDTYRRIENTVNTSRFKEDCTHFISLPMNSPEIQHSFLKFKDEVLSKYKGVRGVDERIFQNPYRLHVTVAALVLLDNRDKEKAISVLMKCGENVIKQLNVKEFVVQVKGIEYMNDDPAEVDVLYAKLKERNDDNSLQIVADNIMKAFTDANLSKIQYDNVKLHITLMNTLFRKNMETEGSNDVSERVTFDARPILKDYTDFDFGQIVVPEIHISIRYSAAPDGYYTALHKMKLNQ